MTSHILERVPLQQVRLLPGEHFDAQQAGARYLLELDVDRLLYPFRREAGLPQPTDADGNPVTSYPNWEETGLDGHIAGHYLSACVGFAQVADDPQPFIDRAATVVRSWHECQQSFAGDAVMRGYVGGVPDSRTVFGRLAAGDVESQNFSMNDAWVPMYNVHKTFAGLLDTWADFASIDEQTSQLARTVVLDLADWWCRIAEPLDDETFDRILVSANRSFDEYRKVLPSDTELIPDRTDSFPGPLAGLEAAIASLPEESRKETWLFTVPFSRRISPRS